MSQPDTEDLPPDAPEDDDTPGGLVLVVLGATIFFGGLMVAWAGVLLRADLADLEVVPPPDPMHAPRSIGFLEQTLILEDRHGLRLRREVQADLERYAWEDRDAGLARIPIGRAMDLVVAGELPLREVPDVPEAPPPEAPDEPDTSEEPDVPDTPPLEEMEAPEAPDAPEHDMQREDAP